MQKMRTKEINLKFPSKTVMIVGAGRSGSKATAMMFGKWLGYRVIYDFFIQLCYDDALKQGILDQENTVIHKPFYSFHVRDIKKHNPKIYLVWTIRPFECAEISHRNLLSKYPQKSEQSRDWYYDKCIEEGIKVEKTEDIEKDFRIFAQLLGEHYFKIGIVDQLIYYGNRRGVTK